MARTAPAACSLATAAAISFLPRCTAPATPRSPKAASAATACACTAPISPLRPAAPRPATVLCRSSSRTAAISLRGSSPSSSAPASCSASDSWPTSKCSGSSLPAPPSTPSPTAPNPKSDATTSSPATTPASRTPSPARSPPPCSTASSPAPAPWAEAASRRGLAAGISRLCGGNPGQHQRDVVGLLAAARPIMHGGQHGGENLGQGARAVGFQHVQQPLFAELDSVLVLRLGDAVAPRRQQVPGLKPQHALLETDVFEQPHHHAAALQAPHAVRAHHRRRQVARVGIAQFAPLAVIDGIEQGRVLLRRGAVVELMVEPGQQLRRPGFLLAG